PAAGLAAGAALGTSRLGHDGPGLRLRPAGLVFLLLGRLAGGRSAERRLAGARRFHARPADLYGPAPRTRGDLGRRLPERAVALGQVLRRDVLGELLADH